MQSPSTTKLIFAQHGRRSTMVVQSTRLIYICGNFTYNQFAYFRMVCFTAKTSSHITI